MDPRFLVEWTIWTVLTVGGFIYIEGRALKRAEPGDTLSELVWKITKPWYIRGGAAGSFAALGAHLFLGWGG